MTITTKNTPSDLTFYKYIQAVRQECAHYGLVAQLSQEDVYKCYSLGLSIDTVYKITCDWICCPHMSLEECIAENSD